MGAGISVISMDAQTSPRSARWRAFQSVHCLPVVTMGFLLGLRRAVLRRNSVRIRVSVPVVIRRERIFRSYRWGSKPADLPPPNSRFKIQNVCFRSLGRAKTLIPGGVEGRAPDSEWSFFNKGALGGSQALIFAASCYVGFQHRFLIDFFRFWVGLGTVLGKFWDAKTLPKRGFDGGSTKRRFLINLFS